MSSVICLLGAGLVVAVIVVFALAGNDTGPHETRQDLSRAMDRWR